MHFPSITAHTGCENTQDNTLESALVGISSGADYIEVDVRATRDGELVLSHDNKVLLDGASSILISNTTIEDLIDHRAPVQPLAPVFAEVLDRNRRINLDLKDDTCVDGVVDLVREHDAYGKVVVTGCELARAKQVKSRDPKLRVYLNTEVSPAAIHALCDTASAAGCLGLNIHYRYYSKELQQAAKDLGLSVSVWTVSHRHGFQNYIDCEVGNITTKDVLALVAIEREVGTDH